MPAFHTKNKGPLGDEEIASLVEYMSAFKKEAERNSVKNSLGPTSGLMRRHKFGGKLEISVMKKSGDVNISIFFCLFGSKLKLRHSASV